MLLNASSDLQVPVLPSGLKLKPLMKNPFARSRSAQPGIARPGTPAERRELVLRHGTNGMSFLTLYPGWEHFHPAKGSGFVAFERHNRSALVCGDPMCEPGAEDALIKSFAAWCATERLTPAFVSATPSLAARCRERGWKTLKIGQEPIFELDDYAPRGNKTKKVRSAANQARKGGVTVNCVPAGHYPPSDVAREMREVQHLWQASRKITALAFTLRLEPLTLASDKITVLAYRAGQLEGFVTCIPIGGRNGYYVEDMIRRPAAPNGVSEMLFLAAVEAARERGASIANLGLAPLRDTARQPDGHRVIGRSLGFAFKRLNLFYKFKPLEHFKAKFGPDAWEDSFLVYRPGRLPRVALGLLSAFTPGKFGPVTAALSRFRPAPANNGRKFSPGHIAGIGLTTAAALGYSAVAVQHPGLFLPFQLAARGFAFPVVEVGEVARAHLIIDSVLLAAGAGWFVRSSRSE